MGKADMKLHLPSSLRVALVACMACAATASADVYLTEGVELNADNTIDINASNRFYDGAKGDWGWNTTNITNAAYQIYAQNDKDLSVFGDLEPAITAPEYSMSLDFSKLKDDSKQCWAYTSANMIQYWQTYYGVFANQARTENRNDPVHGLNYDTQYMTQLAGTQSLKLNKLFYDSFENIGSGNGPGRAFGWYLTKENDWGGQKDNTSSPGYFDQYYASYSDTSTYTTTGKLWASSMSDITNSIRGQFGHTQNSDGSWEQTTKGQILHLELSGNGSHAITCYGFETDANGDIIALYVVNSDDTSYNLEKVYTKFTQTSYGEGQIALYYDEACTQSWRGWTVTGWSSINTPQVLQDMLAEYEVGALTWMGNLDSWTNSPAVAADVNELPTDETGWMVYAGTGTQHAGYYNSYYTEGRGVEFNDEATSGSVNVAEDISTPSMAVNNSTLAYTFNGGETPRTITVNEFTKTGSGSVQFNNVSLVAGTALLEGDVRFDALHVTGTLNAAGKRIHANSLTLDGDATIGALGNDSDNHSIGSTALTINGGTTTIQNSQAWTNLQSLTLSDSAKVTAGASLSVSGNISSTTETQPATGSASINTTYCLYVGTAGDASTGHVELAGDITAGSYIKILGNAKVSGNISSNANAWGDADSYIEIGGNATVGGNVSARKHISIGGDLNMAAGKTMTAGGDISISGALAGEAAERENRASATTSGNMELGGNVSNVNLTATDITMGAAGGEALTLESVDITLQGGELTLNNVIVTGDCRFTNTAEGANGIVNLTAQSVTFVLNDSNSTLVALEPQLFSLMQLSEDQLTETPVNKTLVIDSGMLSNLNVTGSITLDLSGYAQEIRQGGYDNITLAFADDMSYTGASTVQATLDGTTFVTAAPTGDNMPSFSVSQLAVPEPTTATLSLLARGGFVGKKNAAPHAVKHAGPIRLARQLCW